MKLLSITNADWVGGERPRTMRLSAGGRTSWRIGKDRSDDEYGILSTQGKSVGRAEVWRGLSIAELRVLAWRTGEEKLTRHIFLLMNLGNKWSI